MQMRSPDVTPWTGRDSWLEREVRGASSALCAFGQLASAPAGGWMGDLGNGPAGLGNRDPSCPNFEDVLAGESVVITAISTWLWKDGDGSANNVGHPSNKN